MKYPLMKWPESKVLNLEGLAGDSEGKPGTHSIRESYPLA